MAVRRNCRSTGVTRVRFQGTLFPPVGTGTTTLAAVVSSATSVRGVTSTTSTPTASLRPSRLAAIPARKHGEIVSCITTSAGVTLNIFYLNTVDKHVENSLKNWGKCLLKPPIISS